MEKTTKEGIKFISSRGGYFNLPDLFFNHLPVTAYYSYDGIITSPTEFTLENELSEYITKQIDYCIREIDFIYDVRYNISRTKVIINGDNVNVVLYMDTKITLPDKEIHIGSYSRDISNQEISDSYNLAKQITSEILTNKTNICINCLFKISDEKEFRLYINQFNETTFIMELTSWYDENYIFNFVVNINE